MGGVGQPLPLPFFHYLGVQGVGGQHYALLRVVLQGEAVLLEDAEHPHMIWGGLGGDLSNAPAPRNF